MASQVELLVAALHQLAGDANSLASRCLDLATEVQRINGSIPPGPYLDSISAGKKAAQEASYHLRVIADSADAYIADI